MKKDGLMKKNSFVKGAFITTFGIVFAKMLGIFYVIPFHSLIGDDGGALYGYAYTVYLFFLSISTAGIPLAISKLVSEYQALGYYKTKRRVFLLGKQLAIVFGVVSFLLILLFAPFIAKCVLGNVVSKSRIEDVTFVIRVIGSAVLIGPLLSIYRGFFEGHRFMSPPSISQVLEQIIRVFIIIFGGFIALKQFHASIRTMVGIALLGATIGAFISYFYLLEKYIKNRNKFSIQSKNEEEPFISSKTIIQKIIYYAIPFIAIDLFRSLFNYTDMFTVVKGLVHYANYSATDAETIYSIMSTWAQKFNMIVLAVSSGIVVSLIPNISEKYVRHLMDELHDMIRKSLSVLLFFIVPMTFGICFLAKPIWILFYGESEFGSTILGYYIFTGAFIAVFTVLISIIQSLKNYRHVFYALIAGFLVKVILNIVLLRTFTYFGIVPYYSFITASIVGYLVSIIYCFVVLFYGYHVDFESVVKHFIDIICGSLFMIIVLYILRFFVPISSSIRIVNLGIILLYAFIGCVCYILYVHKVGVLTSIFGKRWLKNMYASFFQKNVKRS